MKYIKYFFAFILVILSAYFLKVIFLHYSTENPQQVENDFDQNEKDQLSKNSDEKDIDNDKKEDEKIPNDISNFIEDDQINEEEIALIPPDLNKIKEDMRNNSEAVSLELVDFARKITQLVKKAKLAERYALKVIPELIKCATGDSNQWLSAIQASCYLNLKELRRVYPQMFKQQKIDFESQISDQVKTLVEVFEFQDGSNL